jgi:exonuclease SbcC
MTLESLTVRGFMTAFAGKQVVVPLGAMPDGLIAIVGDNGAGKSTLMEAAAAGIYRQFMSRDGDLKTYAQDRDSAIETSWQIGDDFIQSRLTVDGIKGGASAALWRSGDEVAKLNDGKVSTYDAAIARVFPPLHVFKASAFAAQNKSGSFVHASKKDRRDVFNAFLNLDRLVAMSETAKACAAEVERVRGAVRAEIVNVEMATRLDTLQGLGEQIDALRRQGDAATARRDQLADAIEFTEGLLTTHMRVIAAAEPAQLRARQTLEALAIARRELEAHIDANTRTLGAERIEAAQLARDRALEIDAIDNRLASSEEMDAIAALSERRAAIVAEIDVTIANNLKLRDKAEEIRAAVAALADVEPRLQQQRAALEQLHAAERELVGHQAASEQAISAFTKPQHDLNRAKQDAALLEHVPCHGAGEFAACDLLVNAAAAKARIVDLEAQLQGLSTALRRRDQLAATIRDTADAIDASLKQLRYLERLQRAALPVAAYADKLAAAEARIEELLKQRAAADHDFVRERTHIQVQHAKRRAELEADRARLVATWADRETQLQARQTQRAAAAVAAGDVLSSKVQRLETETAAAAMVLNDVSAAEVEAVRVRQELEQLRADRDAAVTAIATAASDVAAVRVRLDELALKSDRVTVLRGRLAQLETELLEWQLLQQALDRDGLPALEVDQAGPEISALTNHILADCFDSRFSVELVTQVAKADGKGMKDDFTLLVTDNHTGQMRDIADLSGGEEVIVAEAFMNAIALYINERSATPMRTFFRDETTGALTKENTQRYVQMLRKVQALGGIHQIVFISHDPDAYALADAQIRVAGGEVSTLLPPYRAA